MTSVGLSQAHPNHVSRYQISTCTSVLIFAIDINVELLLLLLLLLLCILQLFGPSVTISFSPFILLLPLLYFIKRTPLDISSLCLISVEDFQVQVRNRNHYWQPLLPLSMPT